MITYPDLPGIYVSTDVADRVRRYLRMMERNLPPLGEPPETFSIISEGRNGTADQTPNEEPSTGAGPVQSLAELSSVHEEVAAGILAEWGERRAVSLLWPMHSRRVGTVLPT